jgi:ABC-2 type transport system permease protein
MARNLKLYRRFIVMFLRAKMQYRLAFVMDLMIQMVTVATNVLLYWVVFSKFKAINGWTLEQVLFMYFLGMLSYGLSGFFFNLQMGWLSNVIGKGEFDIILTKPINPLFHVVSRQFDFPAFPRVASGIVALVVLSARLRIPWTPIRALLLGGDILGGFLIFSAVWIVVGSGCFWLVRSNAMTEILLSDARSFMDYPIDIYGKGIQSILTFIIPYSFVNYFPARLLLGTGDYTFFSGSFDYLTLAVGVAAFGAAYLLWTVSLKKYKSTGS